MTILHENKNYKVVMGDVPLTNDEIREGYHVVNKTTGVIEYRDFLLPAALEWAEQLDSRLQGEFHKHFSYNEDIKNPLEFTLPLIEDEPTEPSTH